MHPGWIWIDQAVILAVHEAQLAEHGGATGIRDAALLASALARPATLADYGEPHAADLAACYAFGMVRNHPFIDGNKRTAFVTAELFLLLNGHTLRAEDAECVTRVLALAAGDLDEGAFASWLRASITPPTL